MRQLPGLDAGFADWTAMSAWGAEPHSPEEEAPVVRRMLATTFPPPARVAAKTGSLVGVVRNEIGRPASP